MVVRGPGRRSFSFFALCSALLLVPRGVHAHGLYGHVHVTGAAIENLPNGSLRRIFDDPEVFAAALNGAILPDSGYAEAIAPADPRARDYGEHAHWSPYIEDLLDRMRTQYGPTYDTQEEKLAIAYMLGVAAHGFQDELFDSTFLGEVEQRDAPSGQNETDPGLDGIFYADGHVRMYPGAYVPYDDLVAAFMGRADAPLIETQIGIVKKYYVNEVLGPFVLGSLDSQYRPLMPWGSTNYLDPAVPGSFRAEIAPTRDYMLALWERLHGRYDEGDDLVVETWPQAPRRIREASAASVGSMITLVLSRALTGSSVQVSLVDDAGTPHPFDLHFSRWTSDGRILRIRPTADLEPGAFYTVTLEPGAQVYRAEPTTLAHAFRLQVECATPDDRRCKALPDLRDPSIDGVVPAPAEDCGVAGRSGGPWGSFVLVALALFLARRRPSRLTPPPQNGNSPAHLRA